MRKAGLLRDLYENIRKSTLSRCFRNPVVKIDHKDKSFEAELNPTRLGGWEGGENGPQLVDLNLAALWHKLHSQDLAS